MAIDKNSLRGNDMSASSTAQERSQENNKAPETSLEHSDSISNAGNPGGLKNEAGDSEASQGRLSDLAGSAKDAAIEKGANTAYQRAVDNNQTGDSVTDETANRMANSLSSGINDAMEAKKGYQHLRDARNKMSKDSLGDAKGKSGSVEAAKEKMQKKVAAAKSKKVDIGKAMKGLGKAALVGIKAFFATPVGWIILGVILILFLCLMVFYSIHNSKEEDVAQGNYTSEYAGDTDEEIKQTWTGVYYQKYSDMSIYAQVDTSSISKGNSDICPDTDNGSLPSEVGGDSGIDACSGESFQELSGTSLGDINTSALYQEGTNGWTNLNIQDANNLEDYLGISAGSLSLLDEELNGENMNPGQFIKPVYANCMANLEEFLSNSENDADEDGEVTIKDCAIRKYDSDGNAVDIDEKNNNGDDASLYLTYAESTAFSGDNENNSSAELETDDEGNTKKETGQWDYGLGTLAHYVAVYQPSRVTNYNVDNVQYVCDGDGTSNGVSIAACSGAKFGDVVAETDTSHSGSIDTSTMTSVYADAYVPASTLYYRDWHVNGDSFDADAKGETYTSTSGEYKTAGIARDQWKYEPALSTGVPQTEVKYVIDKAITFAGTVTFDISQDWVTETSATHQQKIAYSRTKTDIGSVEEAFPTIGSNTELVEDFSVNERCIYYNGEKKACGFNTGDKLTWIAEGKRTYKVKTTATTSTGDKESETTYKVPAHFEDSEGNMYKNGAVVGKYTSKSAKKKMGTTSDDRSAYQWGASISATIVISKTGDLQTYAVKYTSSSPTYTDSTRTSYLTQYIKNYTSYIEDKNGGGKNWECYSASETLSEDDASDYEKAKKVTSSGTLLKEVAGLNAHDEIDRFCYLKDSYDTTDSLELNSISKIQYNSMAGRMGYTLANLKQSQNSNIETVENELKTSLGQATDNQLLSTLAKTDPYGQSVSDIVSTYSGQYGVDSSLLALIIAEENSSTGNVTGVSAGSYAAYNISTRARATEHSGGSSKSSDTKVLSGVVNFIRQMFGVKNSGNEGQSVSVGDNSKETMEVTNEQLEEGGMLKDNGSGETSVSTYNASNAAAISSGSSLENAKTVYSLFKSKGYSDIAIAGALGNFQQESSVGFTTIEVGKFTGDVMSLDDLNSYTKNTVFSAYGDKSLNKSGYKDSASGKYICGLGLVQWTGSRAGSLISYASSKGGEWTTPSIQIDFMMDEINNTYSKSSSYDVWKNATTVEEAASAWYKMYESGGKNLTGEEKTKRVGYATTYYQKITNGDFSGVSSTTSSTTGKISNTNAADIVETTDNDDNNWDPSDPWYGQSAEMGGESLLSAVDDDNFGTIATIDVYPSSSTSTAGVISVKNESGDEKVILVSTGVSGDTTMDYADIASPSYESLPSDSKTGSWTNVNGSEWSPLTIKLTNSVSITSIPYTSQSRDSLKSGAYQHLIDKTPGSSGNLEVALKDLIWLYKHVDASTTTWKIRRGESYNGYLPDAIEKASESTVKVMEQSNIHSGNSNASASTVSVLSGAALSTKIAAMYIQTLQVKYDYNVPMILTAYGLGEDFMDAVLECYENETGIDTQSAIEDTKDTAWADYRKYVYEHPEEFDITLDTDKTYDYAEKVLSRMTGTKIYYQKIDLRYDKEKGSITTADNLESDTSQHTIGVWDSSTLYDSIADSNSTQNVHNQAHVNRAIRALNKESGENYITESQWKDITSGQVEYPDDKYDVNDISSYYDKDKSYLRITKDLDDNSVTYLISRMMRFGTDEAEGENDYSSDSFVQSKISKLLGSGTNSWTSTVSTEELFGVKEIDTTFTYRSFTDDGYLIVRKYGYKTDEYGDRNYRPYVTYQDSNKKSGDVYSPLDGKVVEVGEDNDYGKFVTIQLETPNNRTDLYIKIGNLKDVEVKEGDEADGKVGTSDDKGIFFIGFYEGNDAKNFEDVVQAIKDATPDFGDSDTGGIGSVTTNATPSTAVTASLNGITWKDLLGPNAPSSPSQYAGHKTWSTGGLLMASGYGGDLGMPMGSPIYAPVDGWIAACDDIGGSNMGKSNSVTFAFKGDDGYIYTIYVVHIQNNSCSAAAANGGVVSKGTQIATVGDTGRAFGAHAHVYMNRMSSSYDPSSTSTRYTTTGCSANTQEPCGIKINELFNY